MLPFSFDNISWDVITINIGGEIWIILKFLVFIRL